MGRGWKRTDIKPSAPRQSFTRQHTFKQAVRLIGTFSYHFWMKAMTPLRRGSGDQYLHRKSAQYRDAVQAQDECISSIYPGRRHLARSTSVLSGPSLPPQVWGSFGSWLRTIRPGVAPSELVVACALRQTLPEFLLNNEETASIAKFIGERQDSDTMEMFSVAL